MDRFEHAGVETADNLSGGSELPQLIARDDVVLASGEVQQPQVEVVHDGSLPRT